MNFINCGCFFEFNEREAKEYLHAAVLSTAEEWRASCAAKADTDQKRSIQFFFSRLIEILKRAVQRWSDPLEDRLEKRSQKLLRYLRILKRMCAGSLHEFHEPWLLF